ncbi:MAG: serine/threonine-protein kinase [Dokdonella sp.]
MDEIDYQRKKEAWLELHALDAEAREASLAALAVADAELAKELASRFEATDRALLLLDGVDTPPGLPKLSGYRILRELGRGGMGRVWLAERRLGDAVQQVALKQIASFGWDGEDRRRFERERRILASLHHPHIAALVDGGTDVDGAPWLATSYVEGERLDRYVAARNPSLEARVRLLLKIAGAVAYAHRQLIAHRDVKPANIVVESGGEPRLLDFGIARLLGDDVATATSSGQMTLRYAAPEQVSGDDRHSGIATDVHALGLLLYELIAGRSPLADFRDPAAMVAAILTQDPPPPSSLAHARRGEAEADLDAIALKALRKRPEDRYGSMDAFASDLERWLEREPVEARRGERGYRARAFVRRRWPALAAASLVLAATVTFIAYDAIRTRHQLIAVATERDKVQALADYFSDLFATARPTDVALGDVTARQLLERSIEQLRSDDRRPPSTRATLLIAASSALANLGRYREAGAAADLALELLKAMPDPEPDLLARAWTARADIHSKLGDAELARSEIERAAAQLPAIHDVSTILSVRQIQAVMAEETGDREGAPAVYRQIIDLTRDRLEQPRMLRSHLAAQFNLALVERRSDLARAESRLREVLHIAASHPDADPATAIKVKSSLARTLVDQQRLDEARPLHAAALREARMWFTDGDRWLDVITFHYATLALLDGRSQEAIGMLDAALARPLATRADADAPAWSKRSLRASAALMSGNWDDAIDRLQEVLAWRARKGSSGSAAARSERAQLAYATCRAAPDAANVNTLREALANRDGWSGWFGWKSREFLPACEVALAQRS